VNRLIQLALFIPLLACLMACGNSSVVHEKYIATGDKYYRKGMFREAALLYRTAINKDPRDGDAYLRQARAALKLGLVPDAAAASQHAVALLKEGPDRMEARAILAGLYLSTLELVRFEKRTADETARLAREMIRLDPNSYDGYRIRGQLAGLDAAHLAKSFPAQATKRLEEATSDLKTADSIRPFQTEIMVSLARCLWASDKPDEAEEMLLMAIGQHYDLAPAYSELCHIYAGTGRPEAGVGILKLAIANNPKQYSFLVELAGYYRSIGVRAEMTKTLEALKSHAADFPSAYQVAGDMYLGASDFRQAIREYEQGIAASPARRAEYRRLMVNALLTGNRREEAEALNDSILKENPDDAHALAMRGGFRLEKGAVDQAISELDSLLHEAPSNYLAHFNMGRAVLLKGRLDEARFQFSESVRWAPNFIPARIALADAQLAAREYGNAVFSAEDTLSQDARNSRAMLIRAIGLRQLNKRKEAREQLMSLLQLYPRYDGGWLELGTLDAREGRLKEAELEYRASYEINPDNPAGLVAVARLRLSSHKPDEALGILESEIEKYPGRADLRVALADFEIEAGQTDYALAEYESLLKTLGGNPRAVGEIQLRMGECYRKAGDLQSAVAHLQQARQALPDNARVLLNLGVVSGMLGKQDDAIRFYEASLKINGEDAVVLNNVAYFMAEHGKDLDRALTLAQQARLRMPHELAFADTVAVIYLRMNRVDNALEVLEDVVDKKPTEAVFRLHLAEAFLKKGEPRKARKELEAALANQPSAENAARIKVLLIKAGA
jgi:tetratricopeptide (TPR) repeat protein